MDDRPFHHGNLRVALLDRAEVVLRERGLAALSLREMAREAGVSHGAPRNHFPDRTALLDALAERGLRRLAADVVAATAAVNGVGPSLRAAGAAYLRFAHENPALVELIMATKTGTASPSAQAAAHDLREIMTALVARGVDEHVCTVEQVPRLTLLLSATAQGIANMVATGGLDLAQAGELLDEAIRRFASPVTGA